MGKTKPKYPASFIANTSPPPMLGLYSASIASRNAWLQAQGAPRAVIGVEFIDIGTPNVKERLQLFTNNGVVPFVNVMVGNLPLRCKSIQAINSGECDTVIAEFVSGFVRWGGKAFISPFPEMNGGWVPYGLQPAEYKAAYNRIRNAFIARGVNQSHALFVFAPNGWSQPGHEFERYYPGDGVVDAVGFSFFSGGCAGGDKTTDELYQYLRRMRGMAQGKPIYLTQFGTSTNKTHWMAKFMPYLADSGVAGVLFFDAQDACDYRLDGVTGLGAACSKYTAAPKWDKIFAIQHPWNNPRNRPHTTKISGTSGEQT